MANKACTCSLLPPEYWTTHYGAVDPATMYEYNPECPEHGETPAGTPDCPCWATNGCQKPDACSVKKEDYYPVCPECRQGKCKNCDGDAWDDLFDEPTQCRCTHV